MNKNIDLANLSIEQAARALRDREVSPLELTDAYLDRIQRILVEDRPQLSAVGSSRLADIGRYNDEHGEDTIAHAVTVTVSLKLK